MWSISRTESPPDKPGRLIRRSIAGTPRLNTGLDNSTKEARGAKEMRHGVAGPPPARHADAPRPPQPRPPRPTGPATPPGPQARPPAAAALPPRRAPTPGGPRPAPAPGAGSECGGIQFTPGPSLPYTYTHTHTYTHPESGIHGARETARRTTAYRNYGECAPELRKPRTPEPRKKARPPRAKPYTRPRLPLPRPRPAPLRRHSDRVGATMPPVCRTWSTTPRGHHGRACLKRSCRNAAWWGGWDSNPRPTDYESAALTG